MTETFPEWDWYPRDVPANVAIGSRCHVHSRYAFHHFRAERPQALRIGDAVGAWEWTQFELGPDADVSIGASTCLVGAILATNGRIAIGERCLIANGAVLADRFDALPPDPALGPAGRRSSAAIELGDDVWVGHRAIVLGGAVIGDGAIVGARAIVDFAVPAYAIVAGQPARIVGSCAPDGGG